MICLAANLVDYGLYIGAEKRIIRAVFATGKTESRESRELSRNCNRIRIRADQWDRVALRRMRTRPEAGSQETLPAACMILRMKG